jgi:hypothetical protein
VKHERNGCCSDQQQVERLEKAHGRRCRAANARRKGTPNGTSVVNTS